MLAIFVLGFLCTVVDVVLSSLDVLPDCAGLLAISGVLVFLRNKGKLSAVYPVLGMIAAVGSLTLYFFTGPFVQIPVMMVENILLFIILLPVFRLLYPKRKEKGTLEATQYSTIQSALFFIVVARSFSILLDVFPLVGWIFRGLVWCFAVYIVIMVCRRWQAHLINNKYLED